MASVLLVSVLCHLVHAGNLACAGRPCPNAAPEDRLPAEVFVAEEAAHRFLGRHLLFNRFDFEIFTPGNLERECNEEVCNYEEAREVFENDQDTEAFWKKYTEDKEKRPSRLDITSLLVGLIAAGVAVVIVSLLVWYLCQGKCKDDFSRSGTIRVRRRRSNATLIMRRLEEISLQPVHPHGPPPLMEHSEPPGLPSYEQAIAKSGSHDAPPPPYPGSQPGSIRRS